ncbi:hypothetical protein Natoc_3059 [Natronococcus occultus SP4]|uniref:Uncharacterized protein n=1 Tax=Natronococcus occultus SP4 TaxID=694430 RepID=L0K3Z3_9EURY|nr:hypothetical protein Natoc_3059 [Natronococcus occultus SP4]
MELPTEKQELIAGLAGLVVSLYVILEAGVL